MKILDPNTIYYSNHKLDVTPIINKLYQLREIDPGNKISNVGGWQNSQQLDQFQEFFFLPSLVKDLIGEEISFNNMGIWGNISSTTHYNDIHNHGGVDNQWSGVYYLQTPPNSGNILFHNNLSKIIREYSPKVGDLLIFHSSLLHSVGVNNSDQDRISIAFNFLVK